MHSLSINHSFLFVLISAVCIPLFVSCGQKTPEMTLEEIEAARSAQSGSLIARTVSKPWRGESFAAGRPGGVWNTSITGDPKSFNLLIAERDDTTTQILSPLYPFLVDYNVVTKQWEQRAASYKITTDEKAGTLDITYTIRSDVYWSYYKNAKPRVPVTSDDVVFWYNEICGDEACASSAYNSQFMTMKDGSEKRVTIEKIDDKTFTFHFPRIVADPILATNMNFGPSFVFKAAKDKGGVQAVKDLYTVAANPASIPSMGKYFLTEYTPGQRLVYERNTDYWEKDANGESTAYPQTRLVQIVSDTNTQYLLFKQGKIESYGPSPEQVEDVVAAAQNVLDSDGKQIKGAAGAGKDGYTVFNCAGNLSAPFWSFNQNPKNKDAPYYKWFCRKEFRQAMSCLLNRERIITQTYRGLAEPKYSFFPEPNAFYNESIILKYRYSPAHAEKLLASAGFVKGSDGILRDSAGIPVAFDLTVISSSPIYSDIAQIITDECKKEGITVTVRQTDFQRIVEQLTSTYDWQSLLIGFGSDDIFPTQGSNVWPSAGNLHLWNPLQKTPATDWESRVDYLYQEAGCTIDHEKAKPLWDEYQSILLEQCPIIYLVRGRSFFALRNRWDMTNVYFDNVNSYEVTHVFLAQ